MFYRALQINTDHFAKSTLLFQPAKYLGKNFFITLSPRTVLKIVFVKSLKNVSRNKFLGDLSDNFT